MLSRPPECAGCPLDPIAEGWSEPEGSGALGVLAVAEALGEHEAKEGLPLRPFAQAGAVFQATLKRLDVPREALAVTNICRCRPPRNLLEHMPYEMGAIEHCQRHFAREVERVKPRVIFAMGNVALRTLTGYAGKKRSISNVRGYVIDGSRYPIPVLSSYHPAAIAKDKPNLRKVLRADLSRALHVAKHGYRRPQLDYLEFPCIDDARAWLARLRAREDLPPIVYDIETEESFEGVDESDLRALGGGMVQVTSTREGFEDAPDYSVADMAEDAKIEADEIQTEMVKRTRITQIQFSYEPWKALVLPFVEPFIELAREIMGLPNPKIGWNSALFDDPLLRGEAQFRLAGSMIDAMDVWHHFEPDLPRGLQYVTSFHVLGAEPWKHRSKEDPGGYGACDVAYLSYFWPKLRQDLERWGVWSGYESLTLPVRPILDAAAARGIPIDDAARMELKAEIGVERGKVFGEIQALVPPSILKVEPKNGYANPKVAQKIREKNGLVEGERWEEREFDVEVKVIARKTQKPKKPQASLDSAKAGVGSDVGVANDVQIESREEHVEGSVVGVEEAVVGEKLVRWCRVQPFLPNSPQQILRYIQFKRSEEVEEKVARYLGATPRDSLPAEQLEALIKKAERNARYYVPTDFKKGTPTTAKKELTRLAKKTGDPLFPLNIQYRELAKVEATYVDGWAPDAEGFVHTHFGFGPATAQLDSKRPNSMNAPKPASVNGDAGTKDRLALAFRTIIRAKPERVLIEADFKAFHALTMGFAARDATYMRLARRDIHSFVTGHMLKLAGRDRWLNLPDQQLDEVLKGIKKTHRSIRDKKAKPGIFLIQFGGGWNKLYDLNQESFDSPVEAKQLIDLIKGLFPKIFECQDAYRKLAARQHFLRSPHNFIRWFEEIYRWDTRKMAWTSGRDSEAAMAFIPANMAHCTIREALKRMEEKGWLERYGFVNPVHDSLVFHCERRWEEEAMWNIKGEMEMPSRVLVDPVVAPGGLVCEVEVSRGEDWGHMEEIKLVVQEV